MQLNERFEDPREPHREMIRRAVGNIWTAMPAFISKDGYDHQKQTVKLTIGVKAQEKTFDGQGQPVDKPVSMPQLVDVPIHFPAGGGFTMTWPLGDHDEGIVVFASRCLDFWWQNGDEQPRGSERHHSLSDGMFIPGFKSQPNRLKDPAPSTNSMQIRSNDGVAYLDFSKTGIRFVFENGSVAIDSSGNLTVTGEVTRGQGTGRKVTLGEHTHSQPKDSHGDTEQDTLHPSAE